MGLLRSPTVSLRILDKLDTSAKNTSEVMLALDFRLNKIEKQTKVLRVLIRETCEPLIE